jgi:hypothetical protein
MSALVQFLIDGGESSQLVPLKMLYLIHYMAFSTQTFLPVRLFLPVRTTRPPRLRNAM